MAINTPLDKTVVVRTDKKELLDPNTGLPVTVMYGYSNTHNVVTTHAFNVDGSDYTGNLSTLVYGSGAGPIAVTGTVAVSNLLNPMPVTVSGCVCINNFPAFQAVTVASLPLPANAAKETGGNLSALAALISGGGLNVNILGGGGGGGVQYTDGAATVAHPIGTIPVFDNAGTISKVGSANPLPVGITGSVAVTGTFWQATQPVSGTFWQATQPVSAAALPLPTGAATSANQTNASQKTQIVDGGGNVIASTANALNVAITSGGGTVTQYTDGAASPAHMVGMASVFNNAGTVAEVSNTVGFPVGVVGTVPVSGTFWQATQPVSGTVAVSAIAGALPAGTNAIGHVIADSGSTTAVTGNVTVVQGTGTNLHAVIDSGTVTATVSGSVSVSNFPATQPISAVSLPLPTNAAQETGGNLAIIATAVITNVPVTGTFWQTTQPVSVATLPLPTNAAKETGGNLAGILAALTTGTTGFDLQPASIENQGNLAKLVEYNIDPELQTFMFENYENIEKLSRSVASATLIGQDGRRNSMVTSPTRLDVPFQIQANASGASQVGAYTDCSNFIFVSIQVNSVAGAGSWQPQFSNDGQSWTLGAYSLGTATGASGIFTVATTQTGFFYAPVIGKYFRISCAGTSSFTQGSCTFLSQAPFTFITTTQAYGASSNNTAAPGGTNLGVLPAISNAVAAVLTEGRQQLLSMDNSSNLRVINTTAALGASTFQPPIDAPGSSYALSLNPNGQLRIDTEYLRQTAELELVTQQEISMRALLASDGQYGGGNYGYEFR